MIQQKLWNLGGDVKCVWKVQQKCKIKFSCNGLIFTLEKNCIYKTLVLQFNFCKKKDLGFNYKSNQQDATIQLIYYSKSALRVSGDVFAYHQKQLTQGAGGRQQLVEYYQVV
jgi:hypothetical protein